MRTGSEKGLHLYSPALVAIAEDQCFHGRCSERAAGELETQAGQRSSRVGMQLPACFRSFRMRSERFQESLLFVHFGGVARIANGVRWICLPWAVTSISPCERTPYKVRAARSRPPVCRTGGRWPCSGRLSRRRFSLRREFSGTGRRKRQRRALRISRSRLPGDITEVAARNSGRTGVWRPQRLRGKTARRLHDIS
jgi:hypothetical protein